MTGLRRGWWVGHTSRTGIFRRLIIMSWKNSTIRTDSINPTGSNESFTRDVEMYSVNHDKVLFITYGDVVGDIYDNYHTKSNTRW